MVYLFAEIDRRKYFSSGQEGSRQFRAYANPNSAHTGRAWLVDDIFGTQTVYVETPYYHFLSTVKRNS